VIGVGQHTVEGRTRRGVVTVGVALGRSGQQAGKAECSGPDGGTAQGGTAREHALEEITEVGVVALVGRRMEARVTAPVLAGLGGTATSDLFEQRQESTAGRGFGHSLSSWVVTAPYTWPVHGL